MKALMTSLVGLCLVSTASAANLGISRGSKGELILTASSCEKLQTQSRALCEWKHTLDPSFEIPTKEAACSRSSSGKYSLTITSCLPTFTQKNIQKTLANPGPNCWGTTMNFHGLSKAPRFFWPEEMQYWLESPLCRKLSPNEERLPGDVLNVYSPEYYGKEQLTSAPDAGTTFWKFRYPTRAIAIPHPASEGYTGYQWLLHSVTYITDDLAFGKDSPSKLDPFYYHRMSDVYGRPGSGVVGAVSAEDKACQENQSFVPYLRQYQQPPRDIKSGQCAYVSQVYRCGNVSDYFARSTLTDVQKKVWLNIQSLQAMQEKLFPYVVNPAYRITTSESISMITTAKEVLNRDSARLTNPGLTGVDEMLITLEYFTASGILKSLEQAKVGTAFY